MADITWSAYALAMFTPEQRAAAAAVTYVPDEPRNPIPPPPPSTASGGGLAMWPDGLDPNVAGNASILYGRGWRFEAGRWTRIPAGSLGTVVNPDGMVGGARPSLSSLASSTSIGGGSVLGISVPTAPPVLLPQWVGGRIGTVRQSGGTRPESGGLKETYVVRRPAGLPWTRVVKGAGQ